MKNENVHRFALSALRGDLLERERNIDTKHDRKHDRQKTVTYGKPTEFYRFANAYLKIKHSN